MRSATSIPVVRGALPLVNRGGWIALARWESAIRMQMPSKRCCRSDFRQQGLIRETQEFSVLDSIYPHFGAVIGARRDGQEKTVKTFSSLPEVSGGAGTQRRGNLGEEPVMIG